MSRFNLEIVKSTAAGRWPEIFSAIGNVPGGVFDGRHHPCPKCGGKDRFRLIDAEAGACICNQCLTSGDGFTVLQWLTGDDFATSLNKVAHHLGVSPQRRKNQPDKDLEFLNWIPAHAKVFCKKKPPITPEAIQAIGGRFARYRGQYTVIAIPVWGPSFNEADPVGWILYRADGGELPRGKKGELEWVKVKLTVGSQKGIVGNPASWTDKSAVWWKTEGPTDLLAILSMSSSSLVAFTTANGAMEEPLEWIKRLVSGARVNVVHDADEPGQNGATWSEGRDGKRRPGWCPQLAASAAEVRNVTLPFIVEKTKGQDLRDYFNGGGTIESLTARAAEAEAFTESDQGEVRTTHRTPEDPRRLALVNLAEYRRGHDGRLVYWKDEWWKWKSGRYRPISNSELRAKVHGLVEEELERAHNEQITSGEIEPGTPIKSVTIPLVRNVVAAMEAQCILPSSTPMPCWMPDRSQPHYLTAKNGILDLDALLSGDDDILRPHSPDWFSPLQLEYAFDPDAKCPRWIEAMNFCMERDQERINLLQEWSGYLLTHGNPYQRFLVLEGQGGNGKTVYFAAMRAMLGIDNVAGVALENFGERFALIPTIGKAANISGDAGNIEHISEGIVKQFTGGDVMSLDRKNKEAIETRATAKLMAAWNTRPHIKDKSMGLWRRMILVPFNREIPPEAKVRGMDEHEWWISSGEAPGILNWAIAGLYRLRTQGEFTRPKVMIEAMDDYRKETNPVLDFFSEYLTDVDAQGEIIYLKPLFKIYEHWAAESGLKRPLSLRPFSRELKRHFSNSPHGRVKNRGPYRDQHFVEGLRWTTDEVEGKDIADEDLF